jgi:hypothetical protein
MSLVIVGGQVVGAYLHMRRGNLAIKPCLLFCIDGHGGFFPGIDGYSSLIKEGSDAGVFQHHARCTGARSCGEALPRSGKAKSVDIYQCLGAGFSWGCSQAFLELAVDFSSCHRLYFSGVSTREWRARYVAWRHRFQLRDGLAWPAPLFIEIEWKLLFLFLVVAIGGMVAGATFSVRLSDSRLRRILAITILVLALL